MDVNECIVRNLEFIGVDYVFGGSGQVNASMLLSLKESEKIKTIIIKNEQAASFMACGYSMFSDKLGVCFATGGPGAFNLFSGMAVALSDSLPILGITGYTSKLNRGKGALNEASMRMIHVKSLNKQLILPLTADPGLCISIYQKILQVLQLIISIK